MNNCEQIVQSITKSARRWLLIGTVSVITPVQRVFIRDACGWEPLTLQCSKKGVLDQREWLGFHCRRNFLKKVSCLYMHVNNGRTVLWWSGRDHSSWNSLIKKIKLWDSTTNVYGPDITCHAIQEDIFVIKDVDAVIALQLWAALRVPPYLCIGLMTVSCFLWVTNREQLFLEHKKRANPAFHPFSME